MKIKLGIFFGGKSVEHEIAIITANQAYEAINKEKYEIVPIYISKKGLMYTLEDAFNIENFKDTTKLMQKCTQVTIVNDGEKVNVVKYPSSKFGKNIINTIDVAFPIMHGTNGEDGTIQGFIELLGLPYIGCDVLSSAIGMDKIVMKKVMKESGLPVVDYVAFYSMDYIKNEEKYIKQIEEKLRYPIIVKAGNLGSSIGIKKANNTEELEEAIEFSMKFSDRVIAENAVKNLKEINCSVIGDMIDAVPSICEEPISSEEILSYTDKYLGGGKTKTGATNTAEQGMAASDKKLPADISDEIAKKIQKLAVETFKVLGCSGVSRVDFLIDNDTGEIYVNEINTIPGALSFYLWEYTGKTFEKELDELVEGALKRTRQREKLVYSLDQNILSMTGGKLGTKGSKVVKK